MSTVHVRKRKGKNNRSYLALEYNPPRFFRERRKT